MYLSFFSIIDQINRSNVKETKTKLQRSKTSLSNSKNNRVKPVYGRRGSGHWSALDQSTLKNMLKKNQQALAHDFATSLPENEENKKTKKFNLPDSGEYSLSLLKDSDEESEPYDQQSFRNLKSIDSKPSTATNDAKNNFRKKNRPKSTTTTSSTNPTRLRSRRSSIASDFSNTFSINSRISSFSSNFETSIKTTKLPGPQDFAAINQNMKSIAESVKHLFLSRNKRDLETINSFKNFNNEKNNWQKEKSFLTKKVKLLTNERDKNLKQELEDRRNIQNLGQDLDYFKKKYTQFSENARNPKYLNGLLKLEKLEKFEEFKLKKEHEKLKIENKELRDKINEIAEKLRNCDEDKKNLRQRHKFFVNEKDAEIRFLRSELRF